MTVVFVIFANCDSFEKEDKQREIHAKCLLNNSLYFEKKNCFQFVLMEKSIDCVTIPENQPNGLLLVELKIKAKIMASSIQ